MRKTALCLAFLLSCVLLHAQQPALLFESSSLNAGTVAEDSGIHNYIFEFQNISSDTLTITKVSSNCHCTTARCNLNKIAPSQKAKIAVNYDPRGHSGSFERKIYVYSDRMDAPEAVLKLKIAVEDRSGLPYRLGVFALESKQIVFEEGKKESASIKLKNLSSSEAALKLECAFLPKGIEAKLDKEQFRALEEGSLKVSCNKKLAKGEYPLYLENGKEKQTKVTIIIK